MLASIVIRTYNEEKFLGDALESIKSQTLSEGAFEVIVVDSGSTDRTRDIARQYGARIVGIEKSEFTFGRSLNIGCKAAKGKCLVFLSGHCVPVGPSWLQDITRPLLQGVARYAFGKQRGLSPYTKYSEEQLFRKYFPDHSYLEREDFFCNNANAAMLRSDWQKFKFNEKLTGLEDMAMAKLIIEDDGAIAYVAEAGVLHIHEETWSKVKIRYEREAIALHQIRPSWRLSFSECLRFMSSAIFLDMGAAIRERKLFRVLGEIISFRFYQYWGSYQGNRKEIQQADVPKRDYFYPR